MASTITSYFNSYSAMNIGVMSSYLSPSFTFRDPGFGDLSAEESVGMFTMFTAGSSKSGLKVTVTSPPEQRDEAGKEWAVKYVCDYKFLPGPKRRDVKNEISSLLKLDDEGKIVRQEDEFDSRAWAWMAGGWGLWIAVVLTNGAVVRWAARKRLRESMSAKMS